MLNDVLQRTGADVVYACGPMPMLSEVARISTKQRVYSECAVEEAMACGIGVCMTCVLPVTGRARPAWFDPASRGRYFVVTSALARHQHDSGRRRRSPG